MNILDKYEVEKYQDLKRKLKQIWECKEVSIIPIIIGALGTVHSSLVVCLKSLGLEHCFKTLQKASFLGSARILGKVLDT